MSPSSVPAGERVEAPTVSVVVCAYTEQRWDDLSAAIASVRAQTRPAHELIVVVDHNDRLLARVRRAFPDVSAVENGERRGLSGARNTGTALATGDVVAFLDDDAAAEPDWLDRLLAPYSDERVIGVGGTVEPVWSGPRPRSFPDEFMWVVGCSYRGLPVDTSPVRNLIGANMSYRRRALEELGGFHGALGRVGTTPMGCEETELCVRAAHRWPDSVVVYEPRAMVRHRVPRSRARWSYFRARCYGEGLSKAEVVRLAGSVLGLASERSYTFRTLPRGVVREVTGAVTARDPAGVLRATGIALGLLYTSAGYVAGGGLRRGGAGVGSVSTGAGDVRVDTLPTAAAAEWESGIRHVG
ncbi:MAG TPA: glycosyltransferase family 2 protein [Acidimicrobiales bacterium]|nr:glycosyltransferase family 2 protein [Acidimicrobiales bacterium]